MQLVSEIMVEECISADNMTNPDSMVHGAITGMYLKEIIFVGDSMQQNETGFP